MAEKAKFRPPVKIIGAEIDPEHLVVSADGSVRHDFRVIVADKDGVDENGNAYVGVGALRSGYYCAKCLEPQDKPFPPKCWLCGFPMADKQAEFLAKAYQGNVRVGPQTDADSEEAAMTEWMERNRYGQRDEITRPSQILLPGKDF